MYCIYSFLFLLCLPLPFFTLFQFLPSSECTQKAKPGSRVSPPASAVTLRASPAPSCPGLRTAWTSRQSCPNSSRCKVQRSQEFTAHYICSFRHCLYHCCCKHLYAFSYNCWLLLRKWISVLLILLLTLYASYISAWISFLASDMSSCSVASWAIEAADWLVEQFFFIFQKL